MKKIFTVKEKYSKQNNWVYVRYSLEAKQNAPRVQRDDHCAQVMIWSNVSGTVLPRSISAKKGLKLGIAFIRRVF